MADPVSLRALVLGLACALVVLVGALQRWSAPMLIGGAVGVALVLREVGHADVLPPWLVIGLIGVVLTALGVTWDRILARLKAAPARDPKSGVEGKGGSERCGLGWCAMSEP